MAEVINLIPKMTSNTVPSGIASASGVFTTYLPWKAFDGVSNVEPCWATTSLPAWLAYEFPSDMIVNSYSVSGQKGSPLRTPKNWTFEGYNENTWIVLDTQTNQTFTDGQKRTYTFTNITRYKKYRLNISSNNGDATYTSVGELEMYYIPQNKILIKKSDGVYVYYGQNPTTLENEWISIGTSPTDEDWLNKGVDVVTQAQLEKLSQQAITGRFAVKRL